MPAKQEQALPAEIYIPLVDSLFKEGRTLFLGTLINAGAIFATYWKTGELSLLICAFLFTIIGFARILYISWYRQTQDSILSVEQARRWEYGYTTGASASVGLLGAWCFLAFATTDDAFTRLASFSMTIGYVIGIFGRNFGSPKFVVVQIISAWLPMTLALLIYGNAYHWFFSILLIPFFLAVKFISDRLRKTLLDAIIASRNVSALAKRFDTALTNMPQGILMFDSDGTVLVSNHKVPHLLGFTNVADVKGWSTRQLLRECRRSLTLSMRDTRRLYEGIRRTAATGTEVVIVEAGDERSLEFTFQAMDNGGQVSVVQDISERRKAEQTINRMARFDSLTGLPNRSQFNARLAQALSKEGRVEHCAIHFIDLDHFKQVNDTFGHSRGDMLLQIVAERIQLLLREVDMPARFGGDEFVILQTNVRSNDEASVLAERLVSEIGQPYMIDDSEVVVGASIGIARLPSDGSSPEQLLKHADMALYNAKAEGRGTWRFFEPEMEVAARARRQIEHDLRTAIDRGEFEIHFQPIVDFATSKIRTCEALIRWRHPERGLVSPAEFIPIAEETGAINSIGRFVLEEACRECLSWPDNVNVAVNISPVQFDYGEVSDLVSDALDRTGLPAHRLEVEITESVLLHNTTFVRRTLQRMRDKGVRISLDDFGTGYSSLGYLHSFPLDKVKIDRSFLEDLAQNSRSMTLLCGITRLSSELGLRVTVEGIENRRQLELVNDEVFVHEGQGYLFSKPLPRDEISDFLRAFSFDDFQMHTLQVAERAFERKRLTSESGDVAAPAGALEMDPA